MMAEMVMKKIISTNQAPKPIGPYSQAVQVGNLLFCSGQIGTGSDASEQTRQVMANITAVLEAAGSNLGQVVKTTIFLKNMADFAVVNEIYGEYFKVNPPARSTVEVAKLPKDALIEIEIIAFLA